MEEYDSIIIGSGSGGLAAAICLARAGHRVAVLEQHYVPGGWCHSFYIDGHRFSPGVHYIGNMHEGGATRKLYEGLGVANDLVFFRMNPQGYEHCWIGNEKINLSADPEQLYLTLSERFPKEKKGLKKYIRLIQQISHEIQLIPKMNGFWDNITIPFRTRHLGKYGLFSLKTVIGWFIKDPLLRNALNIQCGDHAMPPSKANFAFHCAMMDHYLHGGFYPMGGGAGIVKALTKSIKNHAGIIKTGHVVKKILIEANTNGKGNKAIGVELKDGHKIFAKNIISNTDPANTYRMTGIENVSSKLQEKLSKTSYSLSSLMFFVTVNMDLRKAGIDSGNIWLMPDGDMDQLFVDLTTGDLLKSPEFEVLFISCSSLKDPTGYNGHEHTIEVVTFIDYDNFFSTIPKDDPKGEAYEELKKKLCKKMMVSLKKVIPGIEEHIVHLEMGTPSTNEHYLQSTNGNVYGTEKSFRQTGPFSYKQKTEIEGLYLCGASIMAHGVSGSAFSGVKAASLILNCREEDLIKADPNQHLRVFDADNDSNWPDWLKHKIEMRQKRSKINQPLIKV